MSLGAATFISQEQVSRGVTDVSSLSRHLLQLGDGSTTPHMDLGGSQEHLIQILSLRLSPKNYLYFHFVLFESITPDGLLGLRAIGQTGNKLKVSHSRKMINRC
jgi:hypothetical protein